jgi:hypothetical protein
MRIRITRSLAAAIATAGGLIVAAAPLPSVAEAAMPQPVDSYDLGIDANDLVYEPLSNTLFISVGNDASAYANTVVPVDVRTGKKGAPIQVGLEPAALAVADDGRYLYASLRESGSVARVDLTTRVVDLVWSLGGTPNGVFMALDIAVQPGHPTSVAVILTAGSEHVIMFDNGVRRTNAISDAGATEIAFGDDPSVLYGFDPQHYDGTVSRIAVTADGLATVASRSGLFPVRGRAEFWYADGKLFSGPFVADATSLTRLGAFTEFPKYVEQQHIVPDVAGGRAYMIGRWAQLPNANDVHSTVRVFDIDTYLQVDEFDLQGVLGHLTDDFGDFISIGPGDFAVSANGSTYLFNLAMLRGSAGEYTPLTPQRVLDTRTGLGTAGRADPVGPGSGIDVQISGLAGVPATGVDSVVLNATVAAPTERSYLTIWPSGGSMPEASNLNWAPGETRANLVTVLLGSGGRVSLFNERGTAHVVFDIVGYYASHDGPSGSRFRPLAPQRAFDTRSGAGGVSAATVGPGGTLRFDITGSGGVPDAGVTAVALNVTAVDATASSYVTVWPDDVGRPNASSINFDVGATVPNLVIVRVPESGVIDFFNLEGDVHLLADVVGYYTSDRSGQGGRFVSHWPQRIVDTRVDSPYDTPGDLWPGDTLYFDGANEPYAAYVLNVTVTGTVGSGYLSVHPWPGDAPDTSSLNYTNDVSVPNAVIVRTGPGIAFSNYSGFTHVIADVFGAFTTS